MKFVMKYTHIVGIGIVILLSFFFYSSFYYPLLNSDDGVTILMIHHFNWHTDLYYWGQDRYGSIIPLLGQLFYPHLGISALWVETIIRFAILLGGFLVIVNLINSQWLKLVFAIIFFLPPFHMVDVLRNTLGLEYSLLATTFFVFRKAAFCQNRPLKRIILSSLGSIVAIVAIWVSDLAVASLGLMIFVSIYAALQKSNFDWRIFLRKLPLPSVIATGLIGIAGICFIFYARSKADISENYFSLNTVSQFLKAISMFGNSLLDFVLFRTNELFTSYYVLGLIIILTVMLLFTRKVSFSHHKLYMLFLLIQILVLFLAVFAPSWALINGMARRYFVSIYLSSWLLSLLILDSTDWKTLLSKRVVIVMLVFITLVGGFGARYHSCYVWPRKIKPANVELSDFKSLKNTGIISDYWYAYLIAALNPEEIIATPYQGASARNKRFISKVFEKQTILLIKNDWLQAFPDSIMQYDRLLFKAGSPYALGGLDCCNYTIK